MVCPTGPAPHPCPTPACDRCSRQERQGATSGVLALRTAASVTAHSILRPPTPCQLGGPSRAAFTCPGSASRTRMRERVLLPAPTPTGPAGTRSPAERHGDGEGVAPQGFPTGSLCGETTVISMTPLLRTPVVLRPGLWDLWAKPALSCWKTSPAASKGRFASTLAGCTRKPRTVLSPGEKRFGVVLSQGPWP